VVINDGSTDKTSIAVAAKDVHCISHIFNMGIGASFQTGCLYAVRMGYSYIVRLDGDGQHGAKFLQELLTAVRSGRADIVIGSRFLGFSKFKSSFSRRLGISLLSFLITLVTGRRITDPTSGFCAMNKQAFAYFARHCVEDYPEPEIVVSGKDFRILEIPVSMSPRLIGVSSISPVKSMYYMYKVIFSLLIKLLREDGQ
jgi:glycosyltransferase involved in cell wall biosynthesis